MITKNEYINLSRKQMEILKIIKSGFGSYKNIAKNVYKKELDESTIKCITKMIFEIRKKGYDIATITNWGYKIGKKDRYRNINEYAKFSN